MYTFQLCWIVFTASQTEPLEKSAFCVPEAVLVPTAHNVPVRAVVKASAAVFPVIFALFRCSSESSARAMCSAVKFWVPSRLLTDRTSNTSIVSVTGSRKAARMPRSMSFALSSGKAADREYSCVSQCASWASDLLNRVAPAAFRKINSISATSHAISRSRSR